ATAGNSANYTLFNSAGAIVAINGVVIDGSDATHVTLQTAPLPETDLMKLGVQNVADLSGAGNVMNPATNTFRANNFDTAERINTTSAWGVSANGDQITITADGSDIWGTADQCVFLHKTVSGNFDYKVQGVSLPAINAWTKMGLMVRAGTAAGARNATALFTPSSPGQNTYTAQMRDTTGGNSFSSGDTTANNLTMNLQTGVAARPTVAYPSWVRLQRIGNNIYYYYGSNGTNWTFWTVYDSTSSVEGPLPATLELGLALTSHDTARLVNGVTASFIAVNDGALRFALQPTNTTVVEGANCTFAVVAAGGTPYYYQWFTNGIPVQDVTNAAFTFTRVPFSANGLLVSCRVTNLYNESITSTNALLTIVADTVAPTVRYYTTPKICITPTTVRLLYSEPVNKLSAETVSYYQITPNAGGAALPISYAELQSDERTVVLTLSSAMTQGTLYKVMVNNVIDQACCPPNPVPANSTDYFYFAGASSRFVQRTDGFVMMEAENAQRLTTGTTPATDWQLKNIKPGYSGMGYMVVTNVGGTAGGTTAISGGLSQ
ncbi:MAG TPA: immunoglobulin domain-containing protein, partial [Bacillota bacterium]|nr:immunoglobulin domain-containing protein [Bacillota bacterium]